MEENLEAANEIMETSLREDGDEVCDPNIDEDSTDESDEEDDTLQNDSIKKIQVLEKELETNPYYYDKHVELIQLLKKVHLSSKLREARELMSKHFPLTEELWLEWLEDEEEDEEYALGLLNKAVEDYQSVKLWLELALHQMRAVSHGNGKDGAEKVRDVFERALSRCALHCTEASLLWEAYIDYEMLAPWSEDEEDEKYKKILSLITRQLCCPLMGLSSTFGKYKEIVGGEVDPVVQGHYQRSSTLFSRLKPHEDTLKEDSSLEAFNHYIHFVCSNNLDPNLIICLFERAIKVHCLQASLWTAYLDYLSKNLRIDTVLLPVCRRAVRNCPWSVELWIRLLRAMETFKASGESTKATFTEALSVGFSQSFECLSLHTAYLDYLRRAVPWHCEDKQKHVEVLREAFDNANKQLTQAFSTEGDPNGTLPQYQAFIEAKYLGSMEKARHLYTALLKGPLRKNHLPWMQYAQLERSHGDAHHARKVFQAAVACVHEGLAWVLEEFVRFEREEGDLEDYEKAFEKCKGVMKKLEERKVKEAEFKLKKQQQAGKKSKKGDTKSPSKTSKHPSKQPDTHASNKTKLNASHKQQPMQHVTSNKESVVPYQRKRPLQFNRKEAESAFTEQQQQQQQQQQQADNGGFKVPIAPPPGFTDKSKRVGKRDKPHDDVDEASSCKKAKPSPEFPPGSSPSSQVGSPSPQGGSPSPQGGSPSPQGASAADLCTVFISNLDYSTSKLHVAEALAEAGAVREVRLVTNHKGMSKGYAYVQFEQQEGALRALGLDRKSVQGRPMFVSKFKKKEEAPDDQKFKFSEGLEKNKLFVKNLSPLVTQQHLQDLFQTVGEVKEVRLATYRNGHSKGHAYIEFLKEEEASQAVLKLDGYNLKDQCISVAISNPPARSQKSVHKDVAMDTAYTPALGGGKKVMGRKSQLSMLPRSVKAPPDTSACLSNQDFRNMLLQKK